MLLYIKIIIADSENQLLNASWQRKKIGCHYNKCIQNNLLHGIDITLDNTLTLSYYFGREIRWIECKT